MKEWVKYRVAVALRLCVIRSKSSSSSFSFRSDRQYSQVILLNERSINKHT